MAAGILRKHRRAAPIVDINMIPLIDVALVLLIIFMVMTPFLVQQQVRVNLPQSVSGAEAADRPITVTIQKNGEMTLNGTAVASSSLESSLKALLGKSQDRPVMIQADRDIPLQQVVTVMDIAKRLQVAKLGISVQQPKP
jgi:biopolymer transport protein ExbD